MIKEFAYTDGGREVYGYKGDAGDCAVRSIAVATDIPYNKVYKSLHHIGKLMASLKGRKFHRIRSHGVMEDVIGVYLESLGWTYVPFKLRSLTKDKLLIVMPDHITCVINKVMYDNHEFSLKDVEWYGFYIKFEEGKKDGRRRTKRES